MPVFCSREPDESSRKKATWGNDGGSNQTWRVLLALTRLACAKCHALPWAKTQSRCRSECVNFNTCLPSGCGGKGLRPCVSVARLVRNHAAHTAARVGHVALVSRDHVYVRVPHGLPRGFAAVCSHVESIRRISGKQQILEREHEPEAVGVFLVGQLE